jgi:hypothetical protein
VAEKNHMNRRQFLVPAAATAAFTIVPRHVLGGEGFVAPNDKIALGHIGMGTQGFSELGNLLAEPQIQIVAVCDPNTDSNDYVEWGPNSIRNCIRTYLGNPAWREGQPGCPGGREIGRQVVDACYANRRGLQGFKSCAAYADFRELLEKEKSLDAVKIMTPDHLHATIAIAAMKKGKHVMVHKPLANRMYEARLVIETARKTNVATHLLAYGSGAGNAAIAARIKQGLIGKLREVHNWTNRPVWPQYTAIPSDKPPVPKGLDWDLWLGPTLDRPYHPHYTHAVFRGWFDFGGGSMADMGIYSLWPVFTGLGLGTPASCVAWATHTCDITSNVSRVVKNDYAFPTACALHFKFAERPERPALDLFWYDGGMLPRLPEAIERENVAMPIEGILFIGEQGTIMAGFNGQSPQLYANNKSAPLMREIGEEAAPQGAKRGRGAPGGRGTPWLAAFKGGEPSLGSFLNAAAISDAVTLGGVALRALGAAQPSVSQKVVLDNEAMKITNLPAANKYLVREYRKGWEL